jgi:acetyltransferase-like isoleucine patch superfamily enzyme
MTIKKKISIKNVKLGKNVTIIEPVNLYGCTLGDNCFIGPFVEIQKNVRIGKNCKIQSHTFICENTIIGDNCFIGHATVFVNDKFLKNKILPKTGPFLQTKIGNKVLIGSNVTLLPVIVQDNVTIGAGSVITKNCNKNNVYIGNPAKVLKK